MKAAHGEGRLVLESNSLSRGSLLAISAVNLNGNNQYAGQDIWVDLHNDFGSWAAPIGTSGPAPAVNADGYPLAPGSTAANVASYPDGDYALSYQGTGTVSFSGIGSLAGPLVTNNGVTTGTVVINHSTGNGITGLRHDCHRSQPDGDDQQFPPLCSRVRHQPDPDVHQRVSPVAQALFDDPVRELERRDQFDYDFLARARTLRPRSWQRPIWAFPTKT